MASHEALDARSPRAAQFGPELRRLRRQRDVTLVDLAAAMGISAAYLCDVERGRRLPFSAERIAKLVAFLRAPEVYETMLVRAWVDRGDTRIETRGVPVPRLYEIARVVARLYPVRPSAEDSGDAATEAAL